MSIVYSMVLAPPTSPQIVSQYHKLNDTLECFIFKFSQYKFISLTGFTYLKSMSCAKSCFKILTGGRRESFCLILQRTLMKSCLQGSWFTLFTSSNGSNGTQEGPRENLTGALELIFAFSVWILESQQQFVFLHPPYLDLLSHEAPPVSEFVIYGIKQWTSSIFLTQRRHFTFLYPVFRRPKCCCLWWLGTQWHPQFDQTLCG